MRRTGAVRGAFAGFLGLVALHRMADKRSAKRVGGLFDDLASIVDRALSPEVAAIPDLRDSSPEPEPEPSTGAPPRLPIPAPPKTK